MITECQPLKSFLLIYPTEKDWEKAIPGPGEPISIWKRTKDALEFIGSHENYYSNELLEEFLEEIYEEDYPKWNNIMGLFYNEIAKIQPTNYTYILFCQTVVKIFYYLYKKEEMKLTCDFLLTVSENSLKNSAKIFSRDNDPGELNKSRQ